MSYKRYFRWHCDYCHTETDKEDYELPSGWWYIKPKPSEDRKGGNGCPECSAKVPEKERVRGEAK